MKRLPAVLQVAGTLVLILLAVSGRAEADDTFVKFGAVFHPSDADFSKRWFAAFGKDFPLNRARTVYWGIELQGAYYNVEEAGTNQVVPANGFVNLRYKADKFDYRPYAGVGLGMVTSFILRDSGNEWLRHAGLHLQLGMELRSFLIEFQMQRAFRDEAVFEYAIVGGVTF